MIVFLVRPATLEGTVWTEERPRERRARQSWCGRAGEEVHLLSVQARKRESTKGTVMRYIPHLIHLFACVFGSSASATIPTNGGIVAAAIMYMRLFATFRVYMPTARKMTRDVTGKGEQDTPPLHGRQGRSAGRALPERGISMSRTWSSEKPNDLYIIPPKVVKALVLMSVCSLHYSHVNEGSDLPVGNGR